MADTAKLGKIFIGGLSYETTDEKLRSYFGAYGPVTDAVVMKDPISRRSRGFGFITYADPACVDRALAQPNHILDSRRVEAKRAVPRAESARELGSSSRGNGTSITNVGMPSNVGATKKIFVGGLHYETKDADFKKYFTQYGKVLSAEVMFNRETNKSRGFGFVIFENESSVDLVLQENSHVIDGKSVEVKRAVPRTDAPPARSVSSRAGSFSGTTGPGSVGSLDDVSTTSPSLSLAGTPSSSLSSSANNSTSDSNRATSLMVNGTLGGYAAAVRFGVGGIPKSPMTSAPTIRSNSEGSVLPNNNGRMDTSSTISGVAEALSSLVLGSERESNASSPPGSAHSSRDSVDKPLFEAPSGNGHLSPLRAVVSPVADPVMEQWNLSPAAAPQPQQSEIPMLSPSQSGYLSRRLGDRASPTSLSWQGPAWQQSAWGSSSQQQPPHSDQNSSSPPPPASSFFSMFSSPSGHPGSPIVRPSAWSSSAYVPTTTTSSNSSSPRSNGFGGIMSMSMGLPMDDDSGILNSNFGSNVSSSSGGRSLRGGDAFGGGMGLGGFLRPEYNPQHDSELPVDTTTGFAGGNRDRQEKESALDFALPLPGTDYDRHFR